MFRSFPAFVVEGRTQLLHLSGLFLVSQSLGSILSRSRTVTLPFYLSRLSNTQTYTHTCTRTHAHTHTHTRILSFSLILSSS